VYCGFGELELCSPFIAGQSRLEHDTVIEMSKNPVANGVFGQDTENTKVKFVINGSLAAPLVVDFPYFPCVNNEHGQYLIEQGEEVGQSPLVAHQLCALQLFQYRINRNKYLLIIFIINNISIVCFLIFFYYIKIFSYHIYYFFI
jgi:hypothetical protein